MPKSQRLIQWTWECKKYRDIYQMKYINLFEQFIANAVELVTEKREDVGKYNTVKKVISELGRRPSEQDLASFINNNYYDVTEVERGEDDPAANDKIADLVAFFKFDIDDWEIAWADAQNESVVTEAKAYKLKASEFGGDTFSAAYNVKGETTWRVHSTYAIDQVSGENDASERDVVFFEAMPINNDIYIKIGGINNLKRTGSTVGDNFGTTIEEWKKDPKGIAKEASEFLTDATHLKWINKKARSQGQTIKWALNDDYSSVIEDLVNKSLGLTESLVTEASEDRMIKQIERALKDGTSIFKLPMATQKYYNKNKSDFESAVTEAKGLPSHARNLSIKLKTHWLPDTDNKDIYFLADTNKGQTITIDLSVRTGEYKVIDKKDNVIYQGGDPYAAAKLIESAVNEEKIKYVKGKTYQSSGHWTVYVDSNSSGFDIRVNHSAGWRLDPHDKKEETLELLDNGRQRATIYFKSGNIDKFAQQMFDLNDRTTNGNQTKLTAKDYADIIRVWIDMKMANESMVTEARNYKERPDGDHMVKATVCYLKPMTRQRECKAIYFKSKHDALGFKGNVKGFPKGAAVEAIKESKTKYTTDFTSFINESKNEVNDKQLANLQRDIKKINPKIKVYISTHPITKGKLSIELGADHNNEDEIDQINSLLKKHTGDWRTGTMFNEAVKVTPESDVKIDDYTSDNGEEIKAVEIVGAISSSETEDEFLDYFYDAYGQGAFTETDTATLVKYYNEYVEEVTAQETEDEEEAEKAEGGDDELDMDI